MLFSSTWKRGLVLPPYKCMGYERNKIGKMTYWLTQTRGHCPIRILPSVQEGGHYPLTCWTVCIWREQKGKSTDSPLVLQSDRNVTVNARNHMGQLTGQLTVGADAVEAQCKRFEVSSSEDGRVLFSADEEEIVIGADRLKVTGTEGAVFEHSVETPHIRAEPSQDLKLESPTRSLIMEAPRGIQVSAAAGDLKASCRKELHLQSTEGEIFLNADSIRLGNLPVGSFSSSSSSPGSSAARQTIYELCVCPNGKLYLSPAGAGSTCQSSSNICLWS
ncbi:zeta-sarcoglycan isoform X10 [Hemicordylus capensis]|uniref:zeta-sarcoglycan isoform X10 n=1 Tax=Hemicordylus capensis TaxID=884348 RepID=UPI0023031154|nr:zeta-sarcoglycan isoform X10 [Hemicordylus capensis]